MECYQVTYKGKPSYVESSRKLRYIYIYIKESTCIILIIHQYIMSKYKKIVIFLEKMSKNNQNVQGCSTVEPYSSKVIVQYKLNCLYMLCMLSILYYNQILSIIMTNCEIINEI